MLNITSKLTLNQATFLSPNLCDRFTADELSKIDGLVAFVERSALVSHGGVSDADP